MIAPSVIGSATKRSWPGSVGAVPGGGGGPSFCAWAEAPSTISASSAPAATLQDIDRPKHASSKQRRACGQVRSPKATLRGVRPTSPAVARELEKIAPYEQLAADSQTKPSEVDRARARDRSLARGRTRDRNRLPLRAIQMTAGVVRIRAALPEPPSPDGSEWTDEALALAPASCDPQAVGLLFARHYLHNVET